ncbi:MAG: squalene/phytoene synthase family protein [Alphaproteobacteria bacterium]
MEASKTAKDENFPVGSILLPAKLRPHIAKFYNFARYADDVADDKELSCEEKILKLEKLENSLQGFGDNSEETKTAFELRKSLIDIDDKLIIHALDLLKAFKQDALGKHYQVWDELIYYCSYSASPVGRFMLDLHKEPLSTHWSSDRVCVVLQILNHLQDLKKDYLNLKRIYIPSDFMKEYDVKPEDLAADEASLGLRKIINLILDKTDNMLFEGKILPSITMNFGLKVEISIIIALAERLSIKLRLEDPIKHKVSLNKKDWFLSAAKGIFKAVFTRKTTTSCL